MTKQVKAIGAFGLFLAVLATITWMDLPHLNGWLYWLTVIASLAFSVWVFYAVAESTLGRD